MNRIIFMLSVFSLAALASCGGRQAKVVPVEETVVTETVVTVDSVGADSTARDTAAKK